MPVLQPPTAAQVLPAADSASERRGAATLQVVVSLLRLRQREAATPAAGEALARAVDEVETVMTAHHLLNAGSAGPAHDPGPGLAALVDRLSPPTERIRVTTELSSVTVAPGHILPLLLLAHEALANAVQHAFPGGRAGHILLALDRGAAGVPRLRIVDDGVGLPAGLDFPAQGRCGALLLRELARQSGAALTVTSAGGTTVTVELPAAAPPVEEGAKSA